jgi:Ca2+-binding RTX toxin-like protein
VLVGDGDGNFTGIRNSTTGSLASGLSTGDLNRDGKPDLVSTSGSINNASVIVNKTSFVVLRSSETVAEVDGSKEVDYSITVNLDRSTLTINATPAITRTINNFEDVLGTQLKDSITGSAERNFLSGNGGQDTLTGLAANDTLLGGLGNDKMKGDEGNDRLTGGVGNDQLTGGNGKDRFIFDYGKVFALSDGKDRIKDFEQGIDKIVLDRGTFTALRQQVSFASVQGTAAAKTSSALITYVQSAGRLYYNQNGAETGFGNGGLFATIDGANSPDGRLVKTDFLTQK